MDDRKPGTKAPEPDATASSGWSLAHALDGATRRAKPKASLSRHLVGYRVAANDGAAVPHPGVPFNAEAAQPSPEDAALIARAAQSGEAAWAHERVSLIARALDDEASRLAADPQKAGKVAEHLAPLIEQAFAGADAEAPGDYARAILGREREPLETELLAERAVMSVAATQRAERAGRSAAFAEELAMLKEQPQRWAAAHARQGRAIDDLPLDEKRKNALKGAAARAQANAAAEGLLQQDAAWLLEDLDDPEFSGALGAEDVTRWRSEAETAIARRAERIAAESAERALLGASDMRATLKRLKEKDDGPLPSSADVAAALGSDDAAREALAAALKGRKHRYAEAAVALMAPADEAGWLAAAPDKETRTVRELAVATKRAAVAGDPGRWLMQHSATLKELAQDATDDPAQLPRLAEQYAALRNQVRGRAANDDGTRATSDDGARASADANADAPLPDEVAAALAEQVLAGDTPQARLDALTKILDGVAGAESDEGYGAGADADGRAQAAAIARQLETLGLPDGTEARWAQLNDPHTRRAARLALLGAFAKQIREEEAILGGEGEEPEVVGEEGDDRLWVDDIEPRMPRGVGSATETYRTQLIRERINDLVKSGDVSREEANEFLADEGLAALTELELSEETATQLYSADNNEVVAALSKFADVVLLGAEKLAELEEKYGWLAEVALRGAQFIVGGPFKTAISIIVDKGIDAVLREYGDEAFDRAITFVGEQFTNLANIEPEEAQKIGAATIFGLLAVTGVASGAVDTFRFARHIVRRFKNQLKWNANRPSLENESFYADRPETRHRMESVLSMRGVEKYTTTLTKFLSGRIFRDFNAEQKALVNAMFSRTVLPRTLEKHLYGLFEPLMRSERFTISEQFVISLAGAGGHSVKPDLIFLADNISAASVKRVTPFLDAVAKGFAAVLEAKGPLVRLSEPQRILRNKMDEVGRGDSFGVGDLPISEYPPDLLKKMVDVILKERPDVDPELAYLLASELRKHFHPKLPVWQLLAATSGVLGLIAVLDGDQNDARYVAKPWQR